MSQVSDFEAFDPNSNNAMPWATLCWWRSTRFRTHATRALALNCMSAQRDLAKLYGWDTKAGCWTLLCAKHRDTERCQCAGCLRSTIERADSLPAYERHGSRWVTKDGEFYGARDSGYLDVGQYVWVREKNRITDPPQLMYVCRPCHKIYR